MFKFEDLDADTKSIVAIMCDDANDYEWDRFVNQNGVECISGFHRDGWSPNHDDIFIHLG